MNKKLSVSIALLFLSMAILAQKGIFYQAKLLNSQYNSTTKKIAIDDNTTTSLANLFPGQTTDQIVIALNANPFVNGMFVKQSVARLVPFSFEPSDIGGLDVTKYADAIANLMIKRAKEELTVAFFNRFKKIATDNPEFQILFPTTTTNLTNLLSYKYPQMLPALRTSFFADLKQITYHLDELLDLTRYQNLLQKFPEVKVAIRSIRLIHELETGASNAADVLSQFAAFEEWGSTSPEKMQQAGACIKVAGLFSESIRTDDKDNEDVWINSTDIKTLFHDEIFFKVYLGLIYQYLEIHPITWAQSGVPKDFKDFLKTAAPDLFLIQTKLKEFFDLTANVNTAYKNYSNKMANGATPTNQDIYNYINTSIDVIDYGFGIVNIFHEIPQNKNYLLIVKKSNELFKSIYTKSYTAAVNNAFDIFSTLNTIIDPQIDYNVLKSSLAVTGYTGAGSDQIKKLVAGNSLFKKVSDNTIDKAAEAIITVPKVQLVVSHYSMQRLLEILEKIKPYALFMANIVEAKDDEDITAALDAAILPVGSSSIKKYTKFNISVQTYLGAFYNASSTNRTSEGTWSDKYGVTAPIGISFTPGFTSFKKGGSISLFTSLFDLGAIVDYRLNKEPNATSNDPNATVVTKNYKIQLGQIFSPGAYIVYGWPVNLPLSLGFGAQYGPGLSKIDAGNNTIVTNPSWRWNVFLAVDLPFFNLSNKSNDKK